MSDFQFNCPKCQQLLEAPQNLLGQVIQCPSCKGSIQLPEPKATQAAPNDDPQKRIVTTIPITSSAPSSTKPCPYCGETILSEAIKCKHCKANLTGGAIPDKGKSKGKSSNAAYGIQAIVGVFILIVIFVTGFHVITGENVGFRITRRNSFGFAEFIINVDAITGMPWISAKSKYPIGCKVLQREGLIELDDAFQQRVEDETMQEMEKAQRAWGNLWND